MLGVRVVGESFLGFVRTCALRPTGKTRAMPSQLHRAFTPRKSRACEAHVRGWGLRAVCLSVCLSVSQPHPRRVGCAGRGHHRGYAAVREMSPRVGYEHIYPSRRSVRLVSRLTPFAGYSGAGTAANTFLQTYSRPQRCTTTPSAHRLASAPTTLYTSPAFTLATDYSTLFICRV